MVFGYESCGWCTISYSSFFPFALLELAIRFNGRQELLTIYCVGSMLGYPFALWRGIYGGLVMICGALILAISVFTNPRDIELFVRIIFTLISCVPIAGIGGFFISVALRSKNQLSLD